MPRKIHPFHRVCSTDTSVAYPEICERTAQARISFKLMSSSFIPPRQQWAPNAHLHLSIRPQLILRTHLYVSPSPVTGSKSNLKPK